MMKNLILVAAGVSASVALALVSGGSVAAQDAPPPPPPAAPALPPGPGHDQVAATCVVCHPATQVTDRRMSESEWSETLDRMIGLGAKITEEDRPVVLQYLSSNFGTGDTKTEGHTSGG
jgi:hypothetical protein